MARKDQTSVRKRSGRKSRSNIVLDVRKLYLEGAFGDLFRPIETLPASELDFEVQFCEDILTAHPAHFEALVMLGDAYTRKGEFKKGLELDLRLTKIRPENKLVRYNLACSYALNGQKEKAFTCLDKAVELGYRDLEHLRQDHDLDAIRNDPRFQALLEKLEGLQHETSSSQ